MRIVSSELALRTALALSAAGELTLSELSHAVDATPSAIQRALEILLDDGVIQRADRPRPLYGASPNRLAAHVAGLAAGAVPLAEAIPIAARANTAIEFVGQEDRTLVIVFSSGASAIQQSHAARFLEELAAARNLELEYRDHDDVRTELLVDQSLRRRMARVDVLVGDLNRSFPDRRGHWGNVGRSLQRPHDSISIPPPRKLQRLARKHRVNSLKLFGSAVRSDFRPDSDLDVLVSYENGVRPSLLALIELERALEKALGRDVDLVREETLKDDMRERVESEAVVLL